MAVDAQSTKLKQGYEHAEMANIPDDWSVKTIGELCSFSNGYGFRPSDWSKEGLPIIRIQNLNGSKEFNYFNGIPDDSWLVEPGTILFAWAGTRGVSFGPTIWNGPRGVLNQHIYRIHPHKGVESLWLYLALEIATKNIERNAHGFKATLVHVRKEEIANQTIPFPPTRSEQIAIASVLSDIDSLVESLDKLITKKRDFKQAIMQRLLTGKWRLQGFGEELRTTVTDESLDRCPGDWEAMRLASLAGFITKGATPTTYGFGWASEGILFLRSECVSEHGLDLTQSMYISPQANNILRRSEVRAGDILMTITGNVGRVIQLGSDIEIANINQHIARIRIDTNMVSADYVRYFLSRPSMSAYYGSITTGQAYPQISLRQVRDTLVHLPPSKAEQQAIANVLLDVDADIAALEQRRAKTQAIKQGMMQELLTGRRRLV